VRKKLRFWQKHFSNCDFYGRSTFLSSCNLTGGSDVRGKAGPNWVRKIFNCLRSLLYRYRTNKMDVEERFVNNPSEFLLFGM
jgi:hypothetical protein